MDRSAPYSGKAILTADTRGAGSISAPDLAALIVKTLMMPGGIFIRKEVTAFDPTMTEKHLVPEVAALVDSML